MPILFGHALQLLVQLALEHLPRLGQLGLGGDEVAVVVLPDSPAHLLGPLVLRVVHVGCQTSVGVDEHVATRRDSCRAHRGIGAAA